MPYTDTHPLRENVNNATRNNSLYLEDLTVGEVYRGPARTLTETDLTNFSMLSGDWNEVHADAQAMAKRGGERLLHGVFGIAVVTGLMDKAGWFETSAIVMTGIDKWLFVKPLYVGDTVRLFMEITEARTTSKPEKGYVGRRFTLLNQHSEIVQQGEIGLLIKTRPEGHA